MAYRTVFGTYKKILNNAPLADATVQFATSNNDYDVNANYPRDIVTVKTDSTGKLPAAFQLWCNASGENNSQYIVTEPDGFQWKFVLPLADGSPISIHDLRALQQVILPNDIVSVKLATKTDKVLNANRSFPILDDTGNLKKSFLTEIGTNVDFKYRDVVLTQFVNQSIVNFTVQNDPTSTLSGNSAFLIVTPVIDGQELYGAENGYNDQSLAGKKLVFDWTAVPGAEKYRLYAQNTGPFGFVGETTALTFSYNGQPVLDSSVAPFEFAGGKITAESAKINNLNVAAAIAKQIDTAAEIIPQVFQPFRTGNGSVTGEVHLYVIRAIVNGVKSPVNSSDTTKPVNFVVYNGTGMAAGTVRIPWASVPGASQYEIYRGKNVPAGSDPNQYMKLLATVNSNVLSFDDTGAIPLTALLHGSVTTFVTFANKAFNTIKTSRLRFGGQAAIQQDTQATGGDGLTILSTLLTLQGVETATAANDSVKTQIFSNIGLFRVFDALAGKRLELWVTATTGRLFKWLEPDGVTERFSIDLTGDVYRAGLKVVGTRGAPITKLSANPTNAEISTAVNAIIDRLRVTGGHGLIGD